MDRQLSRPGSERSEGDRLMPTTRNLSRRLERLEARLVPTSEERVLIVQFISQDRQIVGTKELKLFAGPPLKRNRRWR
jgi:hypothetical protein